MKPLHLENQTARASIPQPSPSCRLRRLSEPEFTHCTDTLCGSSSLFVLFCLLVCFPQGYQTLLPTLADHCTVLELQHTRAGTPPSLPFLTATIPLIHCICTDFSIEYFHDPNFFFFPQPVCNSSGSADLLSPASVIEHSISSISSSRAAVGWSLREPPPGLGSPSESLWQW